MALVAAAAAAASSRGVVGSPRSRGDGAKDDAEAPLVPKNSVSIAVLETMQRVADDKRRLCLAHMPTDLATHEHVVSMDLTIQSYAQEIVEWTRKGEEWTMREKLLKGELRTRREVLNYIRRTLYREILVLKEQLFREKNGMEGNPIVTKEFTFFDVMELMGGDSNNGEADGEGTKSEFTQIIEAYRDEAEQERQRMRERYNNQILILEQKLLDQANAMDANEEGLEERDDFIEQQRAELEAAEKALADAEEQHAAATREKDAALAEGSKENAFLQRQLDQLQQTLQEQNDIMDKMEADIKGEAKMYEEYNKQRQSELDALRAQLEEKHQAQLVEELEGARKSYRKEFALLESTVVTSQDKVDSLLQENGEMATKLRDAEAKLAQGGGESVNTVAQLEQSFSVVADLRENVRDLEKKNSVLAQRLMEADDAILDVRRGERKLKEEVAVLKSEILANDPNGVALQKLFDSQATTEAELESANAQIAEYDKQASKFLMLQDISTKAAAAETELRAIQRLLLRIQSKIACGGRKLEKLSSDDMDLPLKGLDELGVFLGSVSMLEGLEEYKGVAALRRESLARRMSLASVASFAARSEPPECDEGVDFGTQTSGIFMPQAASSANPSPLPSARGTPAEPIRRLSSTWLAGHTGAALVVSEDKATQWEEQTGVTLGTPSTPSANPFLRRFSGTPGEKIRKASQSSGDLHAAGGVVPRPERLGSRSDLPLKVPRSQSMLPSRRSSQRSLSRTQSAGGGGSGARRVSFDAMAAAERVSSVGDADSLDDADRGAGVGVSDVSKASDATGARAGGGSGTGTPAERTPSEARLAELEEEERRRQDMLAAAAACGGGDVHDVLVHQGATAAAVAAAVHCFATAVVAVLEEYGATPLPSVLTSGTSTPATGFTPRPGDAGAGGLAGVTFAGATPRGPHAAFPAPDTQLPPKETVQLAQPSYRHVSHLLCLLASGNPPEGIVDAVTTHMLHATSLAPPHGKQLQRPLVVSPVPFPSPAQPSAQGAHTGDHPLANPFIAAAHGLSSTISATTPAPAVASVGGTPLAGAQPQTPPTSAGRYRLGAGAGLPTPGVATPTLGAATSAADKLGVGGLAGLDDDSLVGTPIIGRARKGEWGQDGVWAGGSHVSVDGHDVDIWDLLEARVYALLEFIAARQEEVAAARYTAQLAASPAVTPARSRPTSCGSRRSAPTTASTITDITRDSDHPHREHRVKDKDTSSRDAAAPRSPAAKMRVLGPPPDMPPPAVECDRRFDLKDRYTPVVYQPTTGSEPTFKEGPYKHPRCGALSKLPKRGHPTTGGSPAAAVFVQPQQVVFNEDDTAAAAGERLCVEGTQKPRVIDVRTFFGGTDSPRRQHSPRGGGGGERDDDAATGSDGDKMRQLYQLHQLRQLQGPLPRHLLARDNDPTLVLSRPAPHGVGGDAAAARQTGSREELLAIPDRPVQFFASPGDAGMNLSGSAGGHTQGGLPFPKAAAAAPADDPPWETAKAYTMGVFKGGKPRKTLPQFKALPRPGSAPAKRGPRKTAVAAPPRPATRAG